jgi:hypothetical protein
MQMNCPRCGVVRDPRSRFCTNCGYDLSTAAGQPSQSSLPPWAMASPAASYQPAPDSALNWNTSSQGQQTLKTLLLVLGGIALGTIAALVLLALLAIAIPQLRCLFLGAILAIFLVVWLIYATIRRYIRRTFGRIDRLWWLWLS